ncbi:MAG TPA: Ig-like domain-containing protein [Chloroflexota bacterium]|nr:Ig-like domain-containing protein [Chloroflexota bacterium]
MRLLGSSFDRLLLAIILGLGAVVAGFSVVSARLGPGVDTVTTAEALDGASVNTVIGVTFTEPMNIRSVERNFRLTPRVPGDFNWAGNQLLYEPRRSLAYGKNYTVEIGPGAEDVTGKHLLHPFHDTFRTQSQHLLYLGTAGANKGRLVLASADGRAQTIGGDHVSAFAVSPDGSLVAYIRQSGNNPDEIWLLSLADDSTQLVASRPNWSMQAPAISPDDRYVLVLATGMRFCQKVYGCYVNRSNPVIALEDLHSHKLAPFHATADIPVNNFVQFSPTGQIAYTDSGSALTLINPDTNAQTHVPNAGNALLFAGMDTAGDKAAFVGETPGNPGANVLVYIRGHYRNVSRGIYDAGAPSFATSGKQIAYSGYRSEAGINPVYGINIYDFASKRLARLPVKPGWSDWAPQFSPDDRAIAFIQSRPQEEMYLGAGQVWVEGSNGSRPRMLGTGKDIQWVP